MQDWYSFRPLLTLDVGNPSNLLPLKRTFAIFSFYSLLIAQKTGGIMTSLSIVCIILGCYYAFIRFPLAIAPSTTARLLRSIFASDISTRLFGIAWFIPWCIAVYSSSQSEIKLSKLISIWGTLGIIISLYVIVFAAKYRLQTNEKLEIMSSNTGAWGLRLFCLLTAFLGVFLIYLGIKVF